MDGGFFMKAWAVEAGERRRMVELRSILQGVTVDSL
jgi:hypothetical protein